MSRYNLTLKPGVDQNISVTVGWDCPLRSFFAQVHEEVPDSDPKTLLEIGNNYDEIKDIEVIQEAIAPYAELPKDIAVELVKDSGMPHVQSSLQRQMEALAKSLPRSSGR